MPPAGSTDAEPDPSGGTTTGPDDDATGSCGFLDSCSDTEDISEECDLFEQNCPEGEKCFAVTPEDGFLDFYRRELSPEQMADGIQCFLDAKS